MTNWDDYRYLASLVQTGSVRASADRLGVNPSTVTRRLDGLENRFGLKLFVRSHAGLQLTADGQELIAQIEPLAARLSDLEQQLLGRGEAIAGLVRITMPDVFAIMLMAEFADYTRQYPQVRLEFLPGYQRLDLARAEADIAVRLTDEPPESLIGRRLGRYRQTVYASRQYLATHDPVASPESSLWIAAGIEGTRASVFRSQHFPSMPLGPRCNNVMLQHAAVVAHMGITLLPCAVGDADETLARVGNIEPADAQDIWLLFHPDLRGVARIQSVSGHIQAAFGRLEATLLGSQDKPSQDIQ